MGAVSVNTRWDEQSKHFAVAYALLESGLNDAHYSSHSARCTLGAGAAHFATEESSKRRSRQEDWRIAKTSADELAMLLN